MNLTAYDKYKDLGIAWLGTLPQHWEVRRNKNIFYEASQLSKSGEETLLTVSHITGVTPRSEKNVNMFFAETMESYKICKQGDLIINTMWAWMGALGTSKHYGICSPAYNVYRPYKNKNHKDYNPDYFEYLFRIPNSIMEMTRYSKGIVASRLRLYPKDFFQILTPVPPIEEQNTIATYLNKKSIAIDRRISLLEAKILHYKELSRTLINNIVRSGLQKDVPLKESGMRWVGKIPKHWQIKRLKDVDEIIMGQSPEADNYNYEEIGFPFLQGNAEFGFVHPLPTTWCNSANKVINVNDILVSVRAPIGAVNIADRKYGIGRGLCAIRSKKSDYKFLYYHFLSRSEDLNSLGTGSTYLAISLREVRDLAIPFPPLHEQKEISNYLDNKTNTIDAIITNITKQMEGLKVLRKSLINDVVTGKLKVTE